MPCAPFVFMFAAHNTTSPALASSKSLRASKHGGVRSAGIARLRTRIFYTAGAEPRVPRGRDPGPGVKASQACSRQVLPSSRRQASACGACRPPPASEKRRRKKTFSPAFFLLPLRAGVCYSISVSSPRPALAGSCRGRKPKTKPQRREALKKEKTMNKSTMIAAIFAASAFSAFAADV